MVKYVFLRQIDEKFTIIYSGRKNFSWKSSSREVLLGFQGTRLVNCLFGLVRVPDAVPVRSMLLKALSDTATTMNWRVACHQPHDLPVLSLHIVKKRWTTVLRKLHNLFYSSPARGTKSKHTRKNSYLVNVWGTSQRRLKIFCTYNPLQL